MQRKDGFNHTPIAESVDCSRTTVINVLQLAKERSLKFPLPELMSNKALYVYVHSPQLQYNARLFLCCTSS